MTDNEKRAHDLAVAIVQASLQPELLRGMADVNGTNTLTVDPYKAYMGIYTPALEQFNRDFPGGRQ